MLKMGRAGPWNGVLVAYRNKPPQALEAHGGRTDGDELLLGGKYAVPFGSTFNRDHIDHLRSNSSFILRKHFPESK